ncbi:MAG: hypothetical protein F4Y25_14245 [Chloroflexi bacterium]|nr:hypothetical protein [Chloroflexota bacterium]
MARMAPKYISLKSQRYHDDDDCQHVKNAPAPLLEGTGGKIRCWNCIRLSPKGTDTEVRLSGDGLHDDVVWRGTIVEELPQK